MARKIIKSVALPPVEVFPGIVMFQSEPVLIFDSSPISVALHPDDGAQGVVMYTLSSHDDIRAGVAKWLTWPAGLVTAPTTDVAEGPINGLYASGGGGGAVFEVLQ